MPIQWFDILLILVMLISAFLAMQRGLTKEMLSLISFAIAALVALFFYTLFRERVRALIGPVWLADLLLIGIVFLLMLLLLQILFGYLVPGPLPPAGQPGVVDRTLGFIYGLIRGLILVVIAYEITVALTPKETLPRWITEARSLPLVERTGRAMISLLPDNPSSIFRSAGAVGKSSSQERQATLRVRTMYQGEVQWMTA
jgi:membrane protein required for colicin V production